MAVGDADLNDNDMLMLDGGSGARGATESVGKLQKTLETDRTRTVGVPSFFPGF